MISKRIIVVTSSLTIALVSYGIYLARELVTRAPICYWDMQEGFSGLNYAETYLLLLMGIAVGTSLMTTLNGLFLTEGN